MNPLTTLTSLLPQEITYSPKQFEGLIDNPEILLQLVNGNDLNFRCIYVACESKCCKNAGKRFVLIQDLLHLIEQGLEKHVLGTYPTAEIAKKLFENPDDLDFYREFYVMPHLENKGSQCVFLNDDYTCNIYPHRPSVCKTYPFTMQNIKGKPHFKTFDNKLCPPMPDNEKQINVLKTIAKDVLTDLHYIKQTLYLLAFKRDALPNLGIGNWL